MLAWMLAATARPDEVELKRGLVIESDAVVRKAEYLVPSPSETGQVAAVTVRGEGITVDFQGAVLRGTPEEAEPDQRRGVGIRVDGKDVTIKNAVVRGYKVGIVAWNVPGLKLVDCDVSYNWKQRLLSDAEREDTSDWMSYHKNEKDEWLRYGAGAYLRGCPGFEVQGLKATGGQCGLMLMECDEGLVWNCDVRFMSAVGLGMYRSSGNRVMHNRFDWCVRGYSHGVYNRGQDSTGILVYEQSNGNTFAYNSATHGGDGFFLWAGQTTMDTGEGGCNDNVVYGNDFSHSPANGIEATFSRNAFVNNKLLDCWHGVWGGYSFDTLVAGNVFGYNAESVAIEHGQFNRIVGNTFFRDTNSLMLWQNDRAPDPAWGYPKFRDTRNIGTSVADNRITDVSDVAIHLGSAEKVVFDGNDVERAARLFHFAGAQRGVRFLSNVFAGPAPEPREGVSFDGEQFFGPAKAPSPPLMTRGGSQIVANEATGMEYIRQFEGGWNPWPSGPVLPPRLRLDADRIARLDALVRKHAPKPLAGGIDPFLPAGSLRGRKFMLVDEWGPYDFRRPALWPSARPEGARRRYDVLGPAGSWKVVQAVGCRTAAQAGEVPGALELEATSGTWSIVLEYVGGETVDHRGVASPAGVPVRFGAGEDFVPLAWEVAWYGWKAGESDPRTVPEAFRAVLAGPALATAKTDRLDLATGGRPAEGVPADYFATVAESEFESDGGAYTLEVTSDDGVRAYLDGQLVLDEWRYQGPTRFEARLTAPAGRRKLRIEHFEIDGYTALKARLRKARG